MFMRWSRRGSCVVVVGVGAVIVVVVVVGIQMMK